MKKKIFLYLLCINFIFFNVKSASISIVMDQPGLSGFGSSQEANPADVNDSVVSIKTNDLVLDLGEHQLFQTAGNTISGLDGIYINPGLSNITIRNGVIGPVTGRGIYIGDGCSQIRLENITLQNCNTTGILFDGSFTGTGISIVKINECTILSCTGSDGNPAYGMKIIDGSNFRIERCVFESNDAGNLNSGFGLSLENCSTINILESTAASNGGFLMGLVSI